MSSEQQNPELPASVGAFLKQLRNEKNLSIAEVAASLYLQTGVIEAVEQDDYSSLPVKTYAYGYVQSYAKLLGAPVDQVMALYRKSAGVEEPSEPVVQTTVAPVPLETKQPNRWLHTVLYLLLFIAVLAAFAWWRGWRDAEPGTTIVTEPAEPAVVDKTTQTPAPTGQLDYPIKIVEHPDAPSFRAPNTEVTEPATDTGDAADAQTGEETPADTETAPAPETQETDLQEETEEPTTSYENRTIATGVGPDTITLVLNADCWIEIFNADNEKVFYDLARAGQTLQLSGVAPFSVLLGNADAATVAFNNVPFDFAPYVTGIGIARFALGENP